MIDSESTTPARWRPAIFGAAIFVVAYILAAAVAAVVKANLEFVFYLVVMLVLALGVAALHVRVGLSAAVIWALAIWGALHMAGGLVPVPADWAVHGGSRVLYSWWIIPAPGSAPGSGSGGSAGGYLKFDHIVHAYGFAVATWVCWESLRAATGVARASAGLAILCALGGLGLGALNEVVEFAATVLVPDTNVGGYVNTGLDLVANTVGAVLAAAVIWLAGARQSHAPSTSRTA